MKKLLFSLVIALGLFSSCRSPKIVTEIEYRDTVIYKERWDTLDVPVFVAKDTFNFNDYLKGLPIDYKAEGEIKNDKRSLKYKIDSGKINIAYQKDPYMDTIKDLRVKVVDLERRVSEKKVDTVVKEVPVIKYKIPKWALWYMGLITTAVLVYGYIKGWLATPISWIKKGLSLLMKLFK